MKTLSNKKEKDNKINNWEKKIDQYYKNNDKIRLKADLKKSGFQVKDKSKD